MIGCCRRVPEAVCMISTLQTVNCAVLNCVWDGGGESKANPGARNLVNANNDCRRHCYSQRCRERCGVQRCDIAFLCVTMTRPASCCFVAASRTAVAEQ